ncbi:MAG: pentapeptide repeat-containing protein [Urechidicola sp.]|nr:pentapeptide repeat-containing protein [Urechidicola sp.]
MTEFDSEIFKGIDYTNTRLPIGEYDNCNFINCNFSSSDISNCTFIECKFEDCNLSNTLTKNTAYQEVGFLNCKMMGLKFNSCNNFLLAISFKNCQLNLSSFYQLKIKNTPFNNCNLQEVDLTEADLTGSEFNNCDLNRVIFDQTNLEKVDFRTAINYEIDPENNRIKNARFSSGDLIGLLKKYRIKID